MNFETTSFSDLYSLVDGDIVIAKSSSSSIEFIIGVMRDDRFYELAIISNEVDDFIQCMNPIIKRSILLVVNSNRVIGSIPKKTLLYKGLKKFCLKNELSGTTLDYIENTLMKYIDGSKLIRSISYETDRNN